MEPRTRAYIHFAAGTIAGLAAGGFAYNFLLLLVVPRVVEEFSNKLFYYTIVGTQVSAILTYAFYTVGADQYTKGYRLWRMKKRSR